MTTLHESPLLNANAPRSCEERSLCLATTASRPGTMGELSELTERDATYVKEVATRYSASRDTSGKVIIRSGLSFNYAMAGLSFRTTIETTRVSARAAFGQRELAGLAIL